MPYIYKYNINYTTSHIHYKGHNYEKLPLVALILITASKAVDLVNT